MIKVIIHTQFVDVSYNNIIEKIIRNVLELSDQFTIQNCKYYRYVPSAEDTIVITFGDKAKQIVQSLKSKLNNVINLPELEQLLDTPANTDIRVATYQKLKEIKTYLTVQINKQQPLTDPVPEFSIDTLKKMEEDLRAQGKIYFDVLDEFGKTIRINLNNDSLSNISSPTINFSELLMLKTIKEVFNIKSITIVTE